MPRNPPASQLCSNFGALEQVFGVAVTHRKLHPHTPLRQTQPYSNSASQKHNQQVMPVVFTIHHCNATA